MHLATLAFVGVIGFGLSIVPANAAPAVPQKDTPKVSNIVQVMGGCGPESQPNRLGHCIPYRGDYARDFSHRGFDRGLTDHDVGRGFFGGSIPPR
jgi:hypothetical protein